MQTLTFRVVMGPLLVEAEVQVDVLLLIYCKVLMLQIQSTKVLDGMGRLTLTEVKEALFLKDYFN